MRWILLLISYQLFAVGSCEESLRFLRSALHNDISLRRERSSMDQPESFVCTELSLLRISIDA